MFSHVCTEGLLERRFFEPLDVFKIAECRYSIAAEATAELSTKTSAHILTIT